MEDDETERLRLEVRRLHDLVDHLEEETGRRDCAALEAEIGRLNAEVEHARDGAIQECATVVAEYQQRSRPGYDSTLLGVLLSAEKMILKLKRGAQAPETKE